jgi:predicted P-loop ATPase
MNWDEEAWRSSARDYHADRAGGSIEVGPKKNRRLKGRSPHVAPAWLSLCAKDGRGEPIANLANVMIALRSDQAFEEAFAFDQMQRVPILRRAFTDETGFKQHPVTDVDVTALQEQLQLAGLRHIAKDTVHQAVDLRAQQRAFHPLRDYLEGLIWDGEDRLTALFPMYFGAEATPYAAAIGSMFLIAMVALELPPFNRTQGYCD